METLKFNTQICTTVEQSKRLLELGLKKETADCIITQKVDGTFDVFNTNCGLLEVEIIKDASKLFVSSSAWSLHRLMEIGNITSVGFLEIDNIYEVCIRIIASRIRFKLINPEYINN